MLNALRSQFSTVSQGPELGTVAPILYCRPIVTDPPLQLLSLSLADLAGELAELARGDARFQHVAQLATELQQEITQITGQSPPPRLHRRNSAAARKPRARRSTPQLLAAFKAESEALGSTLQQVQQHGAVFSQQQLSDLRLPERTRKILAEAGLTQVMDVANLEPDQALDLPPLTPSNLAEVRAAIMFACETVVVARRQAMQALPEPGADLFEGLATCITRLPPREREVLLLSTGVDERVHEPDEIARAIDCPVDQVRVLERQAMNLLMSQPTTVEACWRLEALCIQFGLSWEDERLARLVEKLYPQTRASYTPLVVALMREKARLVADATGVPFTEPRGVRHFDEIVVATLGRYGDMSADALTQHVRTALSSTEDRIYTDIAVTPRVKAIGPAVQAEDGTFHLPDTEIPSVDDRHIRALNGLIGALQKLGSARISALTTEVNRRLPRHYRVDEQHVRAWLTRHPDLFVQSDADRFKLASLDVDILCGLAKSWTPAETAPDVVISASRPGALAIDRMRERVANEIRELLLREGPLPIARIRSHLYGRIGGASADAAIASSPHYFVREKTGMVCLREIEPGSEADVIDFGAVSASRTTRRSHFWQGR